MKQKPGSIFKQFYNRQDPVIFWSVFFALFLAGIIFLLWGFEYQKLPQSLPLFFSLPWGGLQLVTSLQFTILPAIILLVTLFNIILTLSLHPSQLALKKVISAVTATVAILITITAFKIIFIFI
ncbi:hypothetical protein HYW46_06300 [Candidatus Daviesbacteria bacterium]|nr:hypothetical protein [Candidatus Daviesbacteria bacterium]